MKYSRVVSGAPKRAAGTRVGAENDARVDLRAREFLGVVIDYVKSRRTHVHGTRAGVRRGPADLAARDPGAVGASSVSVKYGTRRESIVRRDLRRRFLLTIRRGL